MVTKFDELLDFFCNKNEIPDVTKKNFKSFCADYDSFDEESSTIEDIEFWWEEYKEHLIFEKIIKK